MQEQRCIGCGAPPSTGKFCMECGTRLPANDDLSFCIDLAELKKSRKLLGAGFFSKVFQGSWRQQPVAVKILQDAAHLPLFQAEVCSI